MPSSPAVESKESKKNMGQKDLKKQKKKTKHSQWVKRASVYKELQRDFSIVQVDQQVKVFSEKQSF